jgi:galactoside O-acetyltransferase
VFYKNLFFGCGAKVSISKNVTISNFQSIKIGDFSSIMSGSFLYSHDNGQLSIGSRCSVNHNVMVDASCGEIFIGNDVLIGPNTVLRAANHNFSDPFTPTRAQGHIFGRIIIGDNVWIGANTVVTANVKIGCGCIVGAGSIVTKDLPDMTVCVGVPAKPIRLRKFDESGISDSI